MNIIFFAIIGISFVVAAFTGSMDAVTQGAIGAAKTSVELAIGLVGIMALFLGLMQIIQEAGALRLITRLIRPVMVRLFPDVPPEHPAMGAMTLNIAANALGLANAATPFGIRAMQELDRLNGEKGTATNAMALFLTINTSAVTLLPTGVIGLRATLESSDPAAILPSTLFASACSTLIGITVCKVLERLPFFDRTRPPTATPSQQAEAAVSSDIPTPDSAPPLESPGGPGSLLPFFGVAVAVLVLVSLAVLYGQSVSAWIIPTLIFGMVLAGYVRGVKVYEVFVEGAKEGFNVALRIIPYLVAILVAVGMFRASGALDFLVSLVGPVTEPLGMPAEALPMAIMRPLSGSGAYGVMAEILNAEGPDSYVGYLVSTLQGSTETTFYVLAVYFGAVQVSRTRHALPAALSADLAGAIGAVIICLMLFT